jgi:hypothetical protein
MVQAGMFVDNISDSHGRAYTIGQGTATHVPVPVHPPLHHTLPNSKCHSKQSCKDQANHLGILPGAPLASPGTPGAHELPQVQTEGSNLLERENKWKAMLWAYLFALAIAYFRVGCRVESHLHCIFGAPLWLTAFMSSTGNPDQVRFDSGSFPVHVDNHASYCMANSPHLFDNLVLSKVGKVDGINDGLEIVGKGTFKFMIAEDDGRTHIIHIPNSLYLPKLKNCLLSPQHWAQEAGDGQ